MAFGKNEVYALTGVIGSGKSSASEIFTSLGGVVIDADKLAQKVLSSEYDRFSEIVKFLKDELEPKARRKISKSIFFEDEQKRIKINRPALAELVFSSKETLDRLNQIVHPEVKRLFEKSLAEIDGDRVVIYDIPLLFESNMQKEFKSTILVYAPERICVERASLRLGLPKEQVIQRMKSQISIEKKKNLVDYIIDNSGDENKLKEEVIKVWRMIQPDVRIRES